MAESKQSAAVVSRDSQKWQHAKEKSLKRDQYRCQHCRVHEGRWNGVDLQVHHIRPVKKAGTHDLENLVTLCNSCHWNLHRHYDDKDKLTPDLLDEDRATWGIPNSRVDLSQLGDCEGQIVEILKENGPTQLKDIADALDYSRGYVQKGLKNLRIGKYVCRVSRGVYAYIPEKEYRELLTQEADETGRYSVVVWDPGTQVELNKWGSGDEDD